MSNKEKLNKEFDVCIVGTGITGSLVADHFIKKGASVIMLDRCDDVYFPTNRKEYWESKWQKKQEGSHLVSRNYWPDAEKLNLDLSIDLSHL